MHVEWSSVDGRPAILVRGLGPSAPGLVRVQPIEALATEVGMAGRWTSVAEGAVFVPRFAPLPGAQYAVVVHRSLLAGTGSPEEYVVFRLD
ncbi:MAG: hypothetical protein JWL70_316, partial [Acidimicrobiia bacterium]|nr:hypothetical protein [Acidimicrobiia bacterium]